MGKTAEEVISELENEINRLNKYIEKQNLMKLGLTEKEYSDKPSKEYYASEYIDKKYRYYKLVPKYISEEDILKISKLQEEKDKLEKKLNSNTIKQYNGISELLSSLGYIIYVICFLFGLFALFSEPLLGLMVWFGGLLFGSIFFGISEIIKLLDKISKK